ncbi:MAG: type I 3-dehydroquinate dehydratase [Phycisphaerales bacterium]|nr:type I 3-dehydroquinate dehydratase [Phycisphaerales bacterium]
MALIAVSIAVTDPANVTGALEAVGASGANLVEWRVDTLATDEAGRRACRSLVEASPLPCILTCRLAEEGGAYTGDEADRIELIESLVTAGVVPRYLDIEAVAWHRDDGLREAVGRLLDAGECGLVLSTHDFDGRPRDLARRLDGMWSADRVSVVKAAWRARSIRDSLEAFELLSDAGGPMIALCMDRFGVMSRVLAGKFGGLLTFAALDEAGSTAPGQPTLGDLRDRYRFDAIAPTTKVYGIVGDPLGHSLSPLVHNAGFTAVGHDGVMVPMPVIEGWESFKASVATMLDQRSLDLSGVCVTLPHKENLVRFVREAGGTLTPIVERSGAANTMVVQPDGSLVADNTDVLGIVDPLQACLSLEGARAAVLGAGGAARAAVAGLLEAGAEVVVYNRTHERAAALVERMAASGSFAGSLEARAGGPRQDDDFQVIVNATSVGMQGGPEPDACSLEALGGDPAAIQPGVVVFETVYAPRETPLVQLATARGARVITGDEMFLAQAVGQFRAWTGQDPPLASWRALLG